MFDSKYCFKMNNIFGSFAIVPTTNILKAVRTILLYIGCGYFPEDVINFAVNFMIWSIS